MSTIISIVRVIVALAVAYLAWGFAFTYLEIGISASGWSTLLIQIILAFVLGVAGGIVVKLIAGIALPWLALLTFFLVCIDTINAYQTFHLPEPLWLDLLLRAVALLLVLIGAMAIAWVTKRSKRKIVLLS